MNFVTIDFETSTSQRDSPCEVGLTFVEDGYITDTKSWLIKPYYDVFNPFNVRIHGITENDVADAPTFKQLWPELRQLLDRNLLIAHNAAFDMSVLRATLIRYNINFPALEYACSCNFSKTVWPGLPTYNLKTLCDMNGITFKHHRAGSDSLATAELALKAFQLAGVLTKADFPSKLNYNIGQIFPEGNYRPFKKV